jgi:WD40-like Beta Propeller Repeat
VSSFGFQRPLYENSPLWRARKDVFALHHFSSDHAGLRPNVRDIADGRWGAPVNPGAPVNSEASEYYPLAAANGALYFVSRRKGGKGGADIFRSRLAPGGCLD